MFGVFSLESDEESDVEQAPGANPLTFNQKFASVVCVLYS